MYNSQKNLVRNHFYARYISVNTDKRDIQQSLLTDYMNSRNYLIKQYLEQHNKFFNKTECNINFKSLKVNDEVVKSSPKDLMTTLKNIAKLNYLIVQTRFKMSYFNECLKVTESEHNLIISLYNNKINDAILSQGYSYFMSNGLGSISITGVTIAETLKQSGFAKQAGKRINWNESKKIRLRLLEEGKVPFAKIKDENGNVLGNNGGEDWFVYYTDFTRYYYRWTPTKTDKTYTKLYTFVPTLKNIKRLKVIVKEHPEQCSLYSQRFNTVKNTDLESLKLPDSYDI